MFMNLKDKMKKQGDIFNLEEVAKVIDVPIKKWVGNCYYISNLIVKNSLVKGWPVYGHYYGHISPQSQLFRRNQPFYRHGWIKKFDSNIADFTRWVFENKKPYLFIGENSGEYDEGGNILRKAMHLIPPNYNPIEKKIELNLDKKTKRFVLDNLLGGSPELTLSQAIWLANLDLETLSTYAKNIFLALEKNNLGAAVPIDNWRAVIDPV